MVIMKNINLIILFLLCFLFKANGQSEPIQKSWIRQDSVFINKIIKAYKKNPNTVDQLLSYKGNKRENLGFNYFLVSGGNGKGYTSIFYEFIYHNNELVSYRLEAQMPSDNRLTKVYKKFYSPLFKINKYDLSEPLYYRYGEMIKPLNDINRQMPLNKDIQFYMTPYSGTMYGDYGGIGSSEMLDNRKNYIAIKNQITPEVCRLLLYSKNPATRLSAVEYYYQHVKLFSISKKEFEDRIRIIYHELPIVSTMSVDLEIEEKAQDLVNYMIKKR